MSLDIVYSSENREHRFRLTSVEFEALARYAEKNCIEAFGLVFGQPDFDHSVRIKTAALAMAVKIVIHAVERSHEMLGYIYANRMECPRGSGLVSRGSGTVTGLKIDGDQYSLETGYEVCRLTKYWSGENGKPLWGEPQDVRHLRLIRTDPDSFFGDVTIKRRRAGGAVMRKLADLQRFLASCSAKSVSVHMG